MKGREWDVEVVKRDRNTGEELDHFSMPYKSDQFVELLRRATPWFPVPEHQVCVFIVRHLPTCRELQAQLLRATNKMTFWVVLQGERVRPQDALRVMMATLKANETPVDKGRKRGRS